MSDNHTPQGKKWCVTIDSYYIRIIFTCSYYPPVKGGSIRRILRLRTKAQDDVLVQTEDPRTQEARSTPW